MNRIGKMDRSYFFLPPHPPLPTLITSENMYELDVHILEYGQ